MTKAYYSLAVRYDGSYWVSYFPTLFQAALCSQIDLDMNDVDETFYDEIEVSSKDIYTAVIWEQSSSPNDPGDFDEEKNFSTKMEAKDHIKSVLAARGGDINSWEEYRDLLNEGSLAFDNAARIEMLLVTHERTEVLDFTKLPDNDILDWLDEDLAELFKLDLDSNLALLDNPDTREKVLAFLAGDK